MFKTQSPSLECRKGPDSHFWWLIIDFGQRNWTLRKQNKIKYENQVPNDGDFLKYTITPSNVIVIQIFVFQFRLFAQTNKVYEVQ